MDGKKVTIIGAAKSGIAAARLLQKHGARVFVTESADESRKTAEKDMLRQMNIASEFGGHTDRALDADFGVISPGVPRTIPLIGKFQTMGTPLYSEIEAASTWLKGTVIAVTGSNGKTTTTTWIAEMCRASGKPWFSAGNIGVPLSDVVESSTDQTLAVLEISSFQAEGLKSFRPHIGVWMNLSPDHMDRYDSVNEYYLAKRRLFERQTALDVLIYNADDDAVVRLIHELPAQRLAFSLQTSSRQGAYIENEILTIRWKNDRIPIIRTSEIGIPGRHNIYNAMAAALAGVAAGIDPEIIRETIRTFKGVEHRLERVRSLDGVVYYNDSKATNVDSALVALSSFPGQRIILVMGGKHKGSSYSPLIPMLGNVRKIFVMGEASDLIVNDLGKNAAIQKTTSLKEAVEKARTLAQSGDVVLLSPACSSFDMFLNYEDRGSQFKRFVMELN